jgi:hypothetical protein
MHRAGTIVVYLGLFGGGGEIKHGKTKRKCENVEEIVLKRKEATKIGCKG